MPKIAFSSILCKSKMPYHVAEQYGRCDIIIDIVCSHSDFTWLQLLNHENKSLKRNIVIGLIIELCWEYVGAGYEHKLSALINRSRSNVLNQTKKYRAYLQVAGKSAFDQELLRIYNESKKELEDIFGK